MNDITALLVIYTYRTDCQGMLFAEGLEGRTGEKKFQQNTGILLSMILTRKKCWTQIYVKQSFGSTSFHERDHAPDYSSNQ